MCGSWDRGGHGDVGPCRPLKSRRVVWMWIARKGCCWDAACPLESECELFPQHFRG